MKKLMFLGTILAATFASVSATFATPSLPNLSAPHIDASEALPNNVGASRPTYVFKVHVQKYTLSSLTIDLPEGIKVGGTIDVVDQLNRSLGATITSQGNKSVISFAQPIAVGTTLKFSMRDMKVDKNQTTFIHLIPVSAKFANLDANIPLGLVRIQIYDN
ncbi:hypothetical protein [Phormidium tenue]|uniref:Uncharacterized protein n=1 Tax=Phormidium tenue FACHB-1050 TaxID=2692857 RepID=A0ABR8CAD0_9CYAN|nr:hypothetical protein [Phormidium tenue]MBD2316517.1 hypothetical protein [Phormidium tenue FACHB-1050]